VYLDAIRLLQSREQGLEDMADAIYNRAREILNKDELLLPFSNFSADPRELLNTELNTIIKQMTLNFLASRNIEINTYKDNADFYYFNNPFQEQGDHEPAVYRNVTFANHAATQKERAQLVNIEHRLVQNIRWELEHDTQSGVVSAFKLKINKFQGIRGWWFVYKLIVSNNIDRQKTISVSVFMEDKDFSNNRIAQYLDKNGFDTAEPLHNIQPGDDLQAIAEAAQRCAEEKANEAYTAVKLVWMDELNKYKQKYSDYYLFKQNACRQINIENIRAAKLLALEKEQQEQLLKLAQQQNIIPGLDLYQAAFVEFA